MNMEYKEICEKELKKLVNKKYVIFTRRGNNSINVALEVVKDLNKNTVLIQDQGGWLTYEKFIEKNKLNCVFLKTNSGLVNPSDLGFHHDSVLLINSMPGYAFLEDMRSIDIEADNAEIFIINDISGSIGTPEAKIGDIVLGSFGNAKPINLGEGGFIATDDKKLFSLICAKSAYNPTEKLFSNLAEKLINLPNRLKLLKAIRSDILIKLEDFDVIMPQSDGINIIVRTLSDAEKDNVIEFCKKNDLEYTICPRYIRVNEKAISIEIKRKV